MREQVEAKPLFNESDKVKDEDGRDGVIVEAFKSTNTIEPVFYYKVSMKGSTLFCKEEHLEAIPTAEEVMKEVITEKLEEKLKENIEEIGGDENSYVPEVE